MGIAVSDHMREMLDKRQKTKFAAIRQTPIYDRVIQVPVRGMRTRCLEFIPEKATGVLPVVFDFHGGGFTNGYPEEDDLLCRRMCDELQVRVYSIEYRLAPDYPYPEGQLDTYEAVNYICDHAEEYQIDTNRMLVWGHSAGANYALADAMRALEDGKYSFQGVLLDYPPLDVATPAKDKFFIEGAIPMELSDLFNASYRLDEQAREPYCSPMFASDEVLAKLPPVTILTCEFDSLREEAENFAQRLIENGVEVTVRRFQGQKHAFTIDYENPESAKAIQYFIDNGKRYLHL